MSSHDDSFLAEELVRRFNDLCEDPAVRRDLAKLLDVEVEALDFRDHLGTKMNLAEKDPVPAPGDIRAGLLDVLNALCITAPYDGYLRGYICAVRHDETGEFLRLDITSDPTSAGRRIPGRP